MTHRRKLNLKVIRIKIKKLKQFHGTLTDYLWIIWDYQFYTIGFKRIISHKPTKSKCSVLRKFDVVPSLLNFALFFTTEQSKPFEIQTGLKASTNLALEYQIHKLFEMSSERDFFAAFLLATIYVAI